MKPLKTFQMSPAEGKPEVVAEKLKESLASKVEVAKTVALKDHHEVQYLPSKPG